MKTTSLVPLLLGMLGIACSSSSPTLSSPVVEDAGTSVDAARVGVGDAASIDAGVDAAPACGTAVCKSQADCQKALGGVGGCWQCKVGCCVAIPNGEDPGAACASMATACTQGVCNGNGGCAKERLAAKTACGFVCNPNDAKQKIEAQCDGNGVCAVDFLSTPSFSNCSTGTCAGSSDKCGNCPPGGCETTCSSDAGAPFCP